MGALAISDLRMLDGEPRVKDLRLGEVLGFGRPRRIRAVVRNNFKELRLHGEVRRDARRTQEGGAPAEEYLLNEAQAVLVCMFSRTNEAAEVRRQIIQVFLAWRHGELTRSTPQPAQRALPDPWEQMANRHRLLAQAVMFDGMRREAAFSEALTIEQARLHLSHSFGPERTPSRSAIGRFWCWLDRVQEAA